MRVLIALDEQDHRSTHAVDGRAVDGELITPVIVACSDADCEVCRTAWFGLVSHGACETAMVVERPGVTERDLRGRLHDWLDCVGVVDRIVQASDAGDDELDGLDVTDPVAAVDVLIDDHVAEIREICRTFPVGAIVSRLGQLVAARPVDLAA